MEIDESEKYLATGDVNGIIKIWNIADYCLGSISSKDIITDDRNYHLHLLISLPQSN